jgi:allophanate hydrolase subunit 2
VVNLQAGEELSIGRLTNGVWVILALAGGFISRPWLGSVSAYARAGVGVLVKSGLELFAQAPRVRSADRLISPAERRDRQPTPPLLVWPGPQWDQFAPEERRRFFQQAWTVSRQCDRVGYRLEGEPLRVPAGEMISEPQPVGAIQIARDGRPIVLMRDGPAVGGYPKMGILDPGELSRLAQCAPGGLVRFMPGEGKSI